MNDRVPEVYQPKVGRKIYQGKYNTDFILSNVFSYLIFDDTESGNNLGHLKEMLDESTDSSDWKYLLDEREINEENAYLVFSDFIKQIMSEDITWNKIITFFTLVGDSTFKPGYNVYMVYECFYRAFTEAKIENWIQDNGGWRTAMEISETLAEYQERYSANDLDKIIQNPVKAGKLCKIFVETPWRIRPEKKRVNSAPSKKLWRILEGIGNYKIFLHHVNVWEETRKELLDSLVNCCNYLNFISKYCAYARIIGCTMESACTIGSYFSTHPNAGFVSKIAPGFGFLGIGLTFLGLKKSLDSFQSMLNVMQKDQELYEPIDEWYKQNKKLEKAINQEFPMKFRKILVNAIKDTVKSKNKIVLPTLLSYIFLNLNEKEVKDEKKDKSEDKENAVEKDKCEEKDIGEGEIKKHEVMKKIIDLISCDKFKDFCAWIVIHEEDQAMVNIFKYTELLPYLQNVLKKFFFQSTAGVPLISFPVARQCFNGLSIALDVYRLQNLKVPGVTDMRAAEKHFRLELETAKKIEKILRQIHNDS